MAGSWDEVAVDSEREGLGKGDNRYIEGERRVEKLGWDAMMLGGEGGDITYHLLGWVSSQI